MLTLRKIPNTNKKIKTNKKIMGGSTMKIITVSKNISPENLTKVLFGNRPAECRPDVDVKNGVCSSDESVNKLKKWLKTKSTKAVDIISEAKEKLGVKYESQLYDENSISYLFDDNKEHIFSRSGPFNTDEWLDNIVIDSTLNDWEVVFKRFKNMGVHMNNFDEKHKKLATADWKTMIKKYDIIASVINTDNYGSSGQHWVCIVVDSKKKTIEYFDSAAGGVSEEILTWMMKISIELNFKEVFINTLKHQYKNTECGVYSLYYILARMHNVHSDYFDNIRIPDELMLESVRKLLFSYS